MIDLLSKPGILKLLVLRSPWRDWPKFTEPHNKFLKKKTHTLLRGARRFLS